jgi:NAD(P)-dependent dehydrogenase (short-subunit alcohol dehydrogenase family)
MAKEKLLVIGARPKSIGHAVTSLWRDMVREDKVVTCGIAEEQIKLESLEDPVALGKVFQEVQPSRVVVTTGVNFPRNNGAPEGVDDGDFEYWMYRHWHTNCYLPMHVLMTWFEQDGEGYPPKGAHFVAVSSNSAHIARSQSMAYNSSKAALSMALRSAARDVGKAGLDMAVYGYEPGLVRGTPMSAKRGGTRMLGLPEGINRRTLASHIVNGLLWGGTEMNGVMVRLDAGEQ